MTASPTDPAPGPTSPGPGGSAPPDGERRRRRFLARMTFACAWGEGLDGFDLGLVSVTLPVITRALGLSPVEAGLVGASSLIGIFIGAPLAGWLTDRLGRRLTFTIDVVCFVIFGLLQAVVTEGWQLVLVRVALGMAIGAEYSIGAAMLAEFAPARNRGRRLASLLVCWYGGYLVAVLTSYLLLDVVGLSWRWVLVTSVLPALVTVVVRIGFPESPRWLLNHGRPEQARAVVRDRLGGEDYFRDERFGSEDVREGGWRALWSRDNRRRVLFVSAFWACNVAPYFAIFTFAPTVLSSLDLSNEAAGTILLNSMAAVGALVGMITIERLGRRRQLIPPFWTMAVALAVVGLWSGAPAWVVLLCFAVFSFMNALQGNLTAVYPIEIFPTEIRSTGVGFAAACSRVGAAAGTFLLPVGIERLGTGVCMIIAAVICVAGALLSQRMAPETTGQDLHHASRQALTGGS